MKKIIALIMFIFLTSGCTVEYQINISELNSINENLHVSVSDNSINVDDIMTKNIGIHYYENYVPFSLIKSPNKKYYIKSYENKIFSLNNTANIYEYSNSAIAKSCFDDFAVWEDYNDYYISASGFTCFEKYPSLDEVKLKIVLNSAIVSSNFDKVDLQTYTKTITRENAGEEISFIFPMIFVPVDQVISRDNEDGGLEDIVDENGEDTESSNQSNDKPSSGQSDEKSSEIDDNENNKSNIIYWIIGIIGFAMIVALAIFIKIRKNNHMFK